VLPQTVQEAILWKWEGCEHEGVRHSFASVMRSHDPGAALPYRASFVSANQRNTTN
jgi:hypothetical protein